MKVKGKNDAPQYSTDVISMSITEEVNKLSTGTIQIYDPNHYYSQRLTDNVTMELEWGYKKWDENAYSNNFSEIFRKGVTVLIQNPGGGGDQNGTITYNCNFIVVGKTGWEQRKWRTFDTGTKESIVQTLMAEMGVQYFHIKFDAGNDQITKNQPIKQDGIGNFQFLSSLASVNGAIFRIGKDQSGMLMGLFATAHSTEATNFSKLITGGKGTPYKLDYKGGINNVQSYSWSRQTNNEGGDVVQIFWVNGKPVFKRYAVDSGVVKAYVFKPERLRDEAQRMNMLGPDAVVRRMTELLRINDFKELVKKGYFVLEDQRTYTPQGLGYELNLECLGDPELTAPVLVEFGGDEQVGFPNQFLKKKAGNLTFYAMSVNHKLTGQGYLCSVRVIDSLGILAQRIAL